MELRQHMEMLWSKIGFKPKPRENEEEDVDDEDEMLDDITVKENLGFTPEYKKSRPETDENEPFTGICIRNLPTTATVSQVVFLIKRVDVSVDEDSVTVRKYKRTAAADIDNLDDACCRDLVKKTRQFRGIWKKPKSQWHQRCQQNSDKR